MVFATDEGSEAVLCLEMLSDVEITGYEEPPPSPERVDLTREMRNRQRSLLEFANDLPGPAQAHGFPVNSFPRRSTRTPLQYWGSTPPCRLDIRE